MNVLGIRGLVLTQLACIEAEREHGVVGEHDTVKALSAHALDCFTLQLLSMDLCITWDTSAISHVQRNLMNGDLKECIIRVGLGRIPTVFT